MSYTLFLCPDCAGLYEQGYKVTELENSFGHGDCERCKKKRYGCRYEIGR